MEIANRELRNEEGFMPEALSLVIPVLEVLDDGESFALSMSGNTQAKMPAMVFSLRAAASGPALAEARALELAGILRTALSAAFPQARCIECGSPLQPLRHVVRLVPAGHDIDILPHHGSEHLAPRLVKSRADAGITDGRIILPSLPGSGEALGLALKMLHDMQSPVRITVRLQKRAMDASLLRAVLEARRSLVDAFVNEGLEDALSMAPAMDLLKELARSRSIWKLDVEVESARKLDDALLDLLSMAFHGTPQERKAFLPVKADLRGMLPGDTCFRRVLPAVIAAGAAHVMAHDRDAPTTDGVMLGAADGDRPIRLSARDRARHLYIIGATGTGKSTLISNLLAEDMEAGRGVILFDPHGDLWDDARRLVPENRRQDVVHCHLADPRWTFSINILAGAGGEPRIERNTITNALIDLFRRVLYPGVPEAFGPMFESYFRNALLLLMIAEGDKASLMNFQTIFLDNDYRRELVKRCDDEEVKKFWELAEEVTWGNDIALPNVAPYIASKLTQITGNPLLRPILTATESSLDFNEVIAEQKICLINLAKGHVGSRDAAFAGGLLSIRMAMAAQAQARLPREERKECFVFMDEFQTYATYMLADLMAESRKFGLRVTLANQTLSQISGGRGRENIVADILGNAANILSFRVGDADAQLLQNWFEPRFTAARLKRLPDHHAVVRCLADGRPIEPVQVRTLPPRDHVARNGNAT